MNAHEQVVERQMPVAKYGNFTVKHELLHLELLKRLNHLGEITPERLAGLGLEQHLIGFAKGDTAEAVPLRLILPVVTARNLLDGFRLHRWIRGANRQRDAGKLLLEFLGRDCSFAEVFAR